MSLAAMTLAGISLLRLAGLFVAGVAAGLTGAVAGLASIASYPALLAAGLPAVVANQTNTVSLAFGSIGSISASRQELRGQRALTRRLALFGLAGGVGGGALLLALPGESFERAVPVLVALGSGAMLVRSRLVEDVHASGPAHTRRAEVGAVVIGVYGGYFGAGAGVMLLALLLHTTHTDLPRANGVKNVVLGLANGVAALMFIAVGDVRWSVVGPLGAGALIGGRLGPWVVRRIPHEPLRIGIAVAGLGLATKLALDTYW